WNEAAAGDRRQLLEAQLAGGELHELRASVPNRPGVVAQIALELGRGGVNITDMALYPASDMTKGVVALWIAGSGAADRAQELGAGVGSPVARAGTSALSRAPGCAAESRRRPTSRSRTGPRLSARWQPSRCESFITSTPRTRARRSPRSRPSARSSSG